jgi:hypothetical protein
MFLMSAGVLITGQSIYVERNINNIVIHFIAVYKYLDAHSKCLYFNDKSQEILYCSTNKANKNTQHICITFVKQI